MTGRAARPVWEEARLRFVQCVVVLRLIRCPDLCKQLRVLLAEIGPADRWSDQDQLRDACRMIERELDGEPAAQRAADQVRRFQPELIDERDLIADRGPAPRRQLGIAKAT